MADNESYYDYNGIYANGPNIIDPINDTEYADVMHHNVEYYGNDNSNDIIETVMITDDSDDDDDDDNYIKLSNKRHYMKYVYIALIILVLIVIYCVWSCAKCSRKYVPHNVNITDVYGSDPIFKLRR